MRSEVEAIADTREAYGFALGCSWACIKERICTMEFVLRSGRAAAIGLLLLLALLGVRSALNSESFDASVGLVFGVSAAVYLAAGAWTLLRGPIALVQAASTMVLVYGVAFLFTRSGTAGVDQWPNILLFRALSAEGVIIWLVLLVGGGVLQRLGKRSLARG
jgi:hypothetical protein